MGDGGTRVDVCIGRDCADDNGEGFLREGGGDGTEGEPEVSVDDLKGCTGLMLGRRIGSGPGEDGRSCQRSHYKKTEKKN